MPRLDRIPPLFLAWALLCAAFGCRAADDKAAAQAEVRAMRKQALEQLYQKNPAAKKDIRASAGYGVFGVVGAQVLLLGGSGGRGIVRDNLTGRDTFMRVGSMSAGLGIGFKDERIILIFKHRDIFLKFLEEGWVFRGEATAVAKTDGQGKGTRDTADPLGIQVYQLTQNGLIAQGTVQGIKYWKDDELN